jgi:hypothetical protein
VIQIRSAYRSLIRKPEGKRTLGRTRRKCEDDFEVDPKEMGHQRVDSTHLGQNRER